MHETRLDGAHCTGRGDAKHAPEGHGGSQAGEEQEEHRGQHLHSKSIDRGVEQQQQAVATTNETSQDMNCRQDRH